MRDGNTLGTPFKHGGKPIPSVLHTGKKMRSQSLPAGVRVPKRPETPNATMWEVSGRRSMIDQVAYDYTYTGDDRAYLPAGSEKYAERLHRERGGTAEVVPACTPSEVLHTQKRSNLRPRHSSYHATRRYDLGQRHDYEAFEFGPNPKTEAIFPVTRPESTPQGLN
eukprot:gene1808-2935_t